jgi:hypothetical protein
MKKNLPATLMMVGLALAIIEELTYKSGVGGVLFGTSGYLKGINSMLPVWTVPGTKTVSARYPNGYPVRLDGLLMLTGASLAAYRKWA